VRPEQGDGGDEAEEQQHGPDGAHHAGPVPAGELALDRASEAAAAHDGATGAPERASQRQPLRCTAARTPLRHAAHGRGVVGTQVVSDLIPGGYDAPVDAARTLRRARLDAGLSLRTLATRAGTSHATLAAYEAGRAVPRVDTLDRVLSAAGYVTRIEVERRPDATDAQRRAKGDELREALELAAHFPARHAPRLRFPLFPHRRPA
jgi:transcriptional regulator with XRE-family HTH domain